MNPHAPVDDFASRHLVALLFLAIDAVAGSIEQLALDDRGGAAPRPPDELDHALVGVVALARGFVDRSASDPSMRTGASALGRFTGRALR